MNLNERRLARRAKPATGRPLQPFRWWHLLRRSVLSIDLATAHGVVSHTVEVRHGGDSNGVVRAQLYLDGVLHSRSRLPALLPVTGGHIDVRRSPAGLRRCHFIAMDGTEHRLIPHPRSAEGRRLRFAQRHPAASRVIGAASVVLLAIGVALGALQVAEPISQIPQVAASLGTFDSPVRLPAGLNLALGLGAALGAVERALRLRYHWLLDGGAAT